ncbi:hypothetical protein PR048_029468 [Dryococelus australis]|uniref:Uncharacterized protein n=1 Tax=Dryococelus australis TaxID=614101 RepID=A0ABQ9GFR7_9NEOP|nr:hypothetical protein PR048_029468 [Dryococelus australis]
MPGTEGSEKWIFCPQRHQFATHSPTLLRRMKELGTVLRTTCHNSQQSCHDMIPLAEFIMNDAVYLSTGFTPREVLTKYERSETIATKLLPSLNSNVQLGATKMDGK